SSPLLRLAGRWAFWPHMNRQAATPNRDVVPLSKGFWKSLYDGDAFYWMWEKTGEALVRRPGWIWLASALPMVPFVVIAGLFFNRLSYDFVGNLPTNAPSVIGTQALEEHFPAGLMGPTTVLVVNPQIDFRSAKGRELVEQLTDELKKRKAALGIADLRSLTAPLGITEGARRAFAGTFAGMNLPKEA